MGKKKQYKILFSEEQRLSDSQKKWIFLLVYLLVIGVLGYGMIKQLVLGKPWGDNSMSNAALILTFSLVSLFMGIIVFIQTRIKLKVYIDREGIHYRFPVFIRKERLILKEQITGYDVGKYSPFKYGTWSLSKGSFYMMDRGVAYKIKGNTGLRLYLAEGKELLIGTQRPEAMKRAMKKLMAENEQLDD